MANEAKFIGLENVTSVANKLAPNIVLGPAFYMADELARLGIKIETGVQYQLTKTVFAGKGGQTRRKEVGNVQESKLGYLFSRKLTANICVHRTRVNEDSFKEKPGNIAINGNAAPHFERTEEFMNKEAQLFSEDVFQNILGGDAASADDEMNLFDGLITVQNIDINDGTVSQGNHNLIPSGAFDAPIQEGDAGAYDAFVAWYNKWDPKLKKQKVNVYGPTESLIAIADAYEQKHRSHQGAQYLDNGNFQLPSHKKLTFVPMDEIKGTRVFATIEGNLILGVNNESDDSFVNVVPEPSRDTKEYVMQIQGIFGFMIEDPTARAFVTNGGTAEMTFNSGDYTKDGVFVTSNDTNLGTVGIKKADNTPVESGTEVPKGTTLTLTATPKANAEFVKWSNGSTSNPTTIVTTGDPMSVTALFRSTSSSSD